MIKHENIIDDKSAEDQVDIFLNFYDPDTDKPGFKEILPDLKRHIRRGRVEITEAGADGDINVKQILQRKTNDNEVRELNYKVIGGAAKEMMKTEFKSEFSKVYAVLGALSGGSKMGISRLTGIDLSVAETLGALFLLV